MEELEHLEKIIKGYEIDKSNNKLGEYATGRLGALKMVLPLVKRLNKELCVTDGLLKERQRVLDAIPECELHGSCVPNALKWIESMKKKVYL